MFRTKRVWKDAIKTEGLSAGMIALARGPPRDHLTDVEAAVTFLAQDVKRNPSDRVDKKEDFSVSDEDKRRIENREWLIFEEFGYARYSTRKI